MDFFVPGVGVGLTHTKTVMIKKSKLAREIGELEAEGENAKKKHHSDDFLNLTLIYQTTIQTMSSSRTAISNGTYVRYSNNCGFKL